jgi:signal transduction histidine kinase
LIRQSYPITEIKVQPIDSAELRRRAEERLEEKTGTTHHPGTEEEPQRLLQELQVHQVELEMQNAELRQARDELETTLGKYTDLYDFAPVAYFTIDHKGAIRRANLTGAGLVGVERSRMVGCRFRFFVTYETRPAFTAFLEKVFMCTAKEACEMALLQEGDAPLCIQVEGTATASGQECHIALIDLTERKRAEVLRMEKEAAYALRMEKEAAEATSQAKSLFLANMSHELRTPMTGILGFLQLALEEDLAPVPRKYLETTLSSASSLLRILNDIIDMSKIEAGKLTIEEKPFSLQWCITEAVNIITPEVRRKGLDFAILVAEEVPDTVVGDQVRLRQVLINLIGNAVKFTEGGKVVVRVTAGRETFDEKREFTFAVTDTGIGIPDDKKGLLFQAFSQVDDTDTRKYGGTGLGLAISREIVELMGGTITFESDVGAGSTFSFTIPLTVVGLESSALLAAESLSSEAITTTQEGERILRVLLAEDDSTIREVLGHGQRISYEGIDTSKPCM